MKPFLTALLLVMATIIRAEDGKSLILEAIDAGVKAESQARTAIHSRNQSQDEETKLIYWSAAREANAKAKSAYDSAISLTQTEYGLSFPPVQDPKAARSTAQDGAWTEGLPAPRAATFMQPNYRRIRGNDGDFHFVSDVPEGDDADRVMALTDPDGRITILSFAMKMAAEYHEPGILASTIHHENHHYLELITTGWDTHEQMEIRAFTTSADAVDAFIPASNQTLREALKESIATVIAAKTAALQAGDVHSPFPSKEQERGADHGSRMPDIDKLPWQQLRGIASRGW